jgi:hypothetical protein
MYLRRSYSYSVTYTRLYLAVECALRQSDLATCSMKDVYSTRPSVQPFLYEANYVTQGFWGGTNGCFALWR